MTRSESQAGWSLRSHDHEVRPAKVCRQAVADAYFAASLCGG